MVRCNQQQQLIDNKNNREVRRENRRKKLRKYRKLFRSRSLSNIEMMGQEKTEEGCDS